MPAELIDGAAVAKKIRQAVTRRVDALLTRDIRPGLTVILVGDDPASAVYVRSKEKSCIEAGMRGETIRMPASTSETELLSRVDQLNNDHRVHGILVQMPLPKQIDTQKVIRRIKPEKDVDGFHPVNVGKTLIGDADAFAPCTPAGVQVLLREYGVQTSGRNVVIIGRSNIVGKPLSLILMQKGAGANATVTVCHSRTRDLAAITRTADILVAAIGQPEFIKAEMVKPGAVVIDVGTSRVGDKIVGDVDFARVSEVASAITPVPRGVGPMTITMLLANTVKAAKLT